MAWSFVQSTSNKLATGGSSATIRLPGNGSAGNRLILPITTWRNGATPTVAVADAKNGAWTKDVFATQTDGPYIGEFALFSIQMAAPLLSTDNVTVTLAGTIDEVDIAGYAGLMEYSGLDTSTSPLDVSSTNSGTSQTPSTGTTGATTGANELMLVMFADDGQNNFWNTAPSGTVRINHMSDNLDGDLWVADTDSGSAGTTQSASGVGANTGSLWTMIAAVYKLKSTYIGRRNHSPRPGSRGLWLAS